MKTKSFIALLTLFMAVSIRANCQLSKPICTQGLQDEFSEVINVISDLIASYKGEVLVPSDPNEIIGTRGYDNLGGTLQWVAATASLPYTIYFENDPELATAAAQKVEVRHRLHAKADISTFAIGAFGFGSHVFTVEGNRSSYQQRLDLTQDMGIYVDVVAGIDIVAGEAFWILQSIDPATGLPPQGTQQGFLPVNDENHSGEGYVSFTIKPKANACITGDELTASASIVFDVNEAIPTNVWHNMVDAQPPTTQLTGTDNGNNEVLLQFSGQDDEGGCGIKQYKLYVSDNYVAYSLYDTYPVGTTATYPTEYDHCYRFFCLGEDNVGNVEAMKAEPELEIGDMVYAQTVNMVTGWNWWSTYIEQSNIEGLTMLENSLGTNGALIKSPNAFVQNRPNGWKGTLYSIQNEVGYKIQVTDACEAAVTGHMARPEDHPITIKPNWNWIGYPVPTAQTVATALANFQPEENDIIKGQNGFARYKSNHWLPPTFTLNPGEAYMYSSEASGNKTLVYANSRVTSNQIPNSLYWTPEVHAFSDNLCLTAVVYLNGEELNTEGVELGAFVNGENRGSATLNRFEGLNHHYAMMTVVGEDGEEIEFGMVNSRTGEIVMGSDEHIIFASDAVIGDFEHPFQIYFNTWSVSEINSSFSMYPNPVKRNESFDLGLPVGETITEVTIVDALGAVVLHEIGLNGRKIKGLPVAGVYVVTVTTQSGNVYHNRLIVE